MKITSWFNYHTIQNVIARQPFRRSNLAVCNRLLRFARNDVYQTKGFLCVSAVNIIAILLILTPAAHAAPKLEQVIDNIQKQYEAMQNLEADFVQESFNKTVKKTQKAQGKLYMKKPGLMHWNYESPEKQIIVADGKFFWWYTIQTKQVVKQNTNQAVDSNLAIAFMGGLGKIQKDFKIEFASAPQEAKGYELKLAPAKPQANVSYLLLTVDPAHYRTQRIVLYDFYGNITTINFSNLKTNQGVDDKLFQFTPPPGTQVITPEDFPGSR